MSESCDAFAVNVQRFSGFASTYDRHRPTPPAVIAEILSCLAQAPRPKLVVDLGCGTGLSTRMWADRAGQVIGIEPSQDMRQEAEARTGAANVSYRAGLSHDTSLEAGSCDIVTCSQALHWMEPQGTFAEARRILRAGGVFAAIDCDWPPTTGSWQVDMEYTSFMRRVSLVEKQRNLSDGLQRWSKDQHISRMQASGFFRMTREIAVHSVETGDASRYVGLALSQGGVQTVLKAGIGEKEIGLDVFRGAAERLLGGAAGPWYFTYRVRVGIV
jgi:ubiquinone/menaquinone biosynthesis C-methylase UbiE